MSPPRLTSAPQPPTLAAAAAARSAAHALAVAPRSSRTPAGIRIEQPARSSTIVCHPQRTRAVIAAAASGCAPGGSSRRQSRSYPASSRARPTVGSTSPPVSSAARSATSSASISRGPACVGRPARAFTLESSESARKRLHARSIAASSPSTAARAGSSASGSVTRSTTLVPSASQAAEASPADGGCDAHQEPPETTGAGIPARAPIPGRAPIRAPAPIPARGRIPGPVRIPGRERIPDAGADSCARAADSWAGRIPGGGDSVAACGAWAGGCSECVVVFDGLLACAPELFTLLAEAVLVVLPGNACGGHLGEGARSGRRCRRSASG